MSIAEFRLASCLLLMFALTLPLPLSADEQKPTIDETHSQKMKAGLVLFKDHVREILVEKCLECHGGKSTKADFDLATRENLLESGYVGKNADDSYLLELIKHTAEPHMPFKAPRLSETEIDHIEKWLDLGAPFDKPLVDGKTTTAKTSTVTDADREFWSFRPLQVVSPPASKGKQETDRNAIDAFVRKRLAENELDLLPPADKAVLIRRLSFDLLGLPPTPQQVAEFVADPDPNAYEKLVERLLDSPRYGERWARHWMDVARFAESHGYEQDYNRPHAYHYRDFLVQALNDDMPYDQFVRWQIAGDEFAPENPLAMMATGFLGAGAFPTQLTEQEFESARYDELDDIIGTIGTAFLGLTVGCARCHDHKFDPISARDYYQLAATFATTIRSEIELPRDPQTGLPAGPVVKPSKDEKANTAKKTAVPKVKVQVTSEGYPHMKHHADGRGFPHFYPEVHYLKRGDANQKDGVADAGYLDVLKRNGKGDDYWTVTPPEDSQQSFRRTGIANWLTDTTNGAGHLAARVIVNRLWHHHFGRGIVSTPSDFGFQGGRPSHPELLDWLAVDLVHHGWKLKRLHKLIVMSQTYRQQTAPDEATAKELALRTSLFGRWSPRRLEAEAIRDGMLAVSGLLDETPFGPGTLNQNMKRRSIYFFIKRSQLIPTMMLFDWPEHLVGIGRRSTTTVAPQALAFLNSPQCRQYAEGLANRTDGLETTAAIEKVYQLLFSREPTMEEAEISQQFLTMQAELHNEANPQKAQRLALVDWCQMMLSTNEFLYLQ
ncbi:PSD1 and planctomycete cytochrome C domain-containing protein [Thalassoroseus pseudoceratinae]|uniref:PSD1 and planctomycete cytochrome C domain-containing protein n=1 Tax=Thalassoroseus pseudoceratinae TaxID=2713176 RepID=UPI001981CFF4|nr:PSD1 and planctomycete cytochrome C domain-containing protein [Thalassoroseus pseudoceratinae]